MGASDMDSAPEQLPAQSPETGTASATNPELATRTVENAIRSR